MGKASPPVLTVVGIGASAGGLDALEHFFDGFRGDSGMAFVVVTHQLPGHTGLLGGLLKKHTAMRVFEAMDGVKVEPNTVYLSPPGQYLSILNGLLYTMDSEPGSLRLPIDSFFRTLAQDKKDHAVGIILSGAGSDGTLGMRAIKGEAGITMAQNPQEAEYPSMPQSAIAAKTVDFVLPVADMAARLMAHVREPSKFRRETVSDPRADVMMAKIYNVLRDRTGNDFSVYKSKTILRRIERRMTVHNIATLEDYLKYLHEDPHETDALFQEMLIGVTSFFRDPPAYDMLWRRGIAPLVKDKPEGHTFRVWVPGCSTGEEPYSLAILLKENLSKRKKRAAVQIFGTDLDKQAIDFARAGLYAAGIANDLSVQRLNQYFTKESGGYRVNKDIRNMVIFAPHNILSDPPFTKMDLISCRNLLIYVDSKAQRQVLLYLHYALNPGGLLFLGNSETVSAFDDLFVPVDRKWKLFAKKEVYHGMHLPGQIPGRRAHLGRIGTAKPPFVRREPVNRESAELIQEMLLNRYVPASVIVNQQGEIIYIHGRTGMFLEPVPGPPNRSVVEMARPGLRAYLATALLHLQRQRTEWLRERVRMRTNSHEIPVFVTLRRMNEPESLRGLILITLEVRLEKKDEAKISASERPRARTEAKAKPDKSGLMQELQYTKHRLQQSVEELETSNEEFKATNEELQSTNEELQSTNEELETAKEELQSLNEELVTLNTELQGKLDELSATNDDLQNLLNSTEVATVFLDTDLRIRRFTAEIRALINLIPTDIGRPLADIIPNFTYANLIHDMEEVLRTLARKEVELQTTDGTWYFMRVLPYRTAQNTIDGVVVAFLNISVQKQAEQVSQSAQAYAESIVETVGEPLLVLDESLRIVSANTAFYRVFHIASRNIEGQLIYALSNGQWDVPRLREMLENIIPKNRVVEDFLVDLNFPGIGQRKVTINARRLEEDPQLPGKILVVFHDGTVEAFASA